jgi:hypothetical protein
MNTKLQTNTQETSINAGKVIDQVISRDQDFPDLASLLNGKYMEYVYICVLTNPKLLLLFVGAPSESYIKPLLSPEEEFVQTNKIPIPKRFFDRVVGTDKCLFYNTIFNK